MDLLGRLKKLITPKTNGGEIDKIVRNLWREAEQNGVPPDEFRDDFIQALKQFNYTSNYGSRIMVRLSDELGIPGLRIRSKRSDALGTGSRGAQSNIPPDRIGNVLSIVRQMTKSERKKLMSELIDLI